MGKKLEKVLDEKETKSVVFLTGTTLRMLAETQQIKLEKLLQAL